MHASVRLGVTDPGSDPVDIQIAEQVFRAGGAELVQTLLLVLLEASPIGETTALGDGPVPEDSISNLLETIAGLEVSLVGNNESNDLISLIQQAIQRGNARICIITMALLAGFARHRSNKVFLICYISPVNDILSLHDGCKSLIR